jgi:L-rhamnose isomerase/sugar isomerase
LPALRAAYDSLGDRLARHGIDIAVIKGKIAAFGVAVRSWGVGTRSARLPGA